MKAMVYQGNGQIALETVPDPKIIEPTDAILKGGPRGQLRYR